MQAGRLIAKRYRIGRRIGSGGMSDVFLADDLREGRTVALKVVLAEAHDDASRRRRFLREAETVKKLDHPNIVRVYDWGEEPDRVTWIAMEFIDGTSLGAILDRGPLPLREVVSIVAPVARALGVAHRAGFAHRDVKPENILVRGDGRPVLVDFGITRSISYQSPSKGRTGEKLTQTGTLVGTPEYMSPEQVRTAQLDGRSDQFSLAVVTYEALTGARPFVGDSPMAIIASVLTDPVVPMRDLVDGIPVEIDDAVLRALSKKPAERLGSMEQFAEVLEEFVPTALSGIELARLIARRSVLPLPGAPTVVDASILEAIEPSRELTTEPSLPAGDRALIAGLIETTDLTPTPRRAPLVEVNTEVAPTPFDPAALEPEAEPFVLKPRVKLSPAYTPLRPPPPAFEPASNAESKWWLVLLAVSVLLTVAVFLVR
ncbi:MAG: serine/threonine protein kinase [Myxococcales bacterium]|nr:serine/threonine protein kinase [Myxococcales bacterium]